MREIVNEERWSARCFSSLFIELPCTTVPSSPPPQSETTPLCRREQVSLSLRKSKSERERTDG
jgi:hypothetical protein